MKNSILKYNTLEFDSYIVTDYTSKTFNDISNLSIFYSEDYIYYHTLIDGDTIENLSYSIYGTSEYWDLILLINKQDALYSMTYEFDALSQWAKDIANEYNAFEYFGGSLGFEHIQYMENVYLKKLIEQNEENRIVKLVKPSRINDVMRLLREKDLI